MTAITFCLNFTDEFYKLFAEMNGLVAICLVAGLILCVVEIFQPGYGVFMGLGILLLIAGIGIRLADGGSFAMLFILAMFIVLLLLAAFMVMLIMSKAGWLGRLKANPAAQQQAQKDYYYLLNMKGVCETDLNPGGSIQIEGDKYDASADCNYIGAGCAVKVAEVDGAKLVVREIKE